MKKFRFLGVLTLMTSLCFSACREPQIEKPGDDSGALEKAVEVVAVASKDIETKHTMTAASWGGIPAIVVKTETMDVEQKPIVDKIMQHEAVQAFEGELLIGFETQTEPANPDANFLGSTTMHGTYDAKTGEKKN